MRQVAGQAFSILPFIRKEARTGFEDRERELIQVFKQDRDPCSGKKPVISPVPCFLTLFWVPV